MNSKTEARILRACYSFLVPLARVLLRNGISFREFSELSRIAFVHVAGRDYGIRGRPTNVSRVAAMTGIGRKEIRRLRLLGGEYERDPRLELNPLTDVLHHWYTDPRYLDSSGLPLKLPYRKGPVSFCNLVKQTAGDVPAGAIKVELTRCGAVREDGEGYLTALRRHVVPEAFDEKLISAMAFGLRGLVTTIAHNSDPERVTEPHIERVVHSDPLTLESRKVLRELLRKRIMAFTEEVDDLFSIENQAGSSPRSRIGVGVYYYEDDE